jgi:hypothetical protein
VWAEVVPEDQWKIGQAATPLRWGGGSGCPEGTSQAVRVTWAGGITKPGGGEVDDTERLLYRVTVAQEESSKAEISPFALGDLGDGDNNHLLCLDVDDKPEVVFFPEGYVTDPREDLNPETPITLENS